MVAGDGGAAGTPSKAAVVQMCATADVHKNLRVTGDLVARAAQAGAGAVFAPEAFTFIGPGRERAKMLEPLPGGGPVLEECRAMAADNRVHFVFGFHERAPDGRSFNTCVHLDPEGQVAALYRKIHLFDVDLADGPRLLESRGTAPGNSPVVTELPFGILGLSVCYDVRFPVLYQRLVDLGAIALTVPSAFTRTTGRDHWHVLLRARAIECQAYVIAPAQYGEHGHANRISYGHSLIVDPWGDVVAECPESGDGFAIAEIDPGRVQKVRRELPSLANRNI
ncbi:MAG: carbon-nitrogen hydrolase family protein [Gammaproteobacteria bacterium]|nr:carbon-nitrogen hydrolase family protein [Gammaproteobacteria bacterium]MDE0367735.1 carbon-nitrogen hydrolase family protein [Gammaproteobacteria bacterium]